MSLEPGVIQYLDERGPFVLISSHSARAWYGVFDEQGNPIDDFDQTDFGLACTVEEWVGKVEVRGMEVLVFGGEPLSIGVRSAEEGTTITFRVQYASGLSNQLFESLPEAVWNDTGVTIALEGDYVLFSASCFGGNREESLSLRFSQGLYSIQKSMLDPDPETSLILHRFLLR